MEKNKNWHQEHVENLSFGSRIADKVATGMGSWRFIMIQTIIVAVWMVLNFAAFIYHWDPYPFILLNLLFSTQTEFSKVQPNHSKRMISCQNPF